MTTFTVQHGQALLALLVTLDTRHAMADQAAAKAKAETWARILGQDGVDPGWCRVWVEGQHREPRGVPLSLGDIRRGWATFRRVQRAKDREGALPGLAAPPSVSAYLHDVLQAVQAGRHPSTVMRPGGVKTLSPLADERSRRCGSEICVCTHTECRAGWLDVEVEHVNTLGLRYSQVQRCPSCMDAVTMAQEPAMRGRRR